MATLARKLAKIMLLIAIFCFVSWCDVRYLSEHPLISNDTAIKIAYWFSSVPTPEDIYFSFDYVMIASNIIISIIFYVIALTIIRKISKY
jgi:hypothetical protein